MLAFLTNGAGTTSDPYEKNVPWPLPHNMHRTQLEMDDITKHEIKNYKFSLGVGNNLLNMKQKQNIYI